MIRFKRKIIHIVAWLKVPKLQIVYIILKHKYGNRYDLIKSDYDFNYHVLDNKTKIIYRGFSLNDIILFFILKRKEIKI